MKKFNEIAAWIVKYFKETQAEVKKVVWPDQNYIGMATIIILVIVFLTGAYVLSVDFIFSKTIGVLIK